MVIVEGTSNRLQDDVGVHFGFYTRGIEQEITELLDEKEEIEKRSLVSTEVSQNRCPFGIRRIYTEI